MITKPKATYKIFRGQKGIPLRVEGKKSFLISNKISPAVQLPELTERFTGTYMPGKVFCGYTAGFLLSEQRLILLLILVKKN